MSASPIQRDTPRERRVLILSSLLFLAALAADQAVKVAVDLNFQLHESVVLIPGYFNLTYARNTGAAWSMFSEHTWLLLIFGVLIGVVVIFFFRRWAEGWPERYAALALIESGIVGNSIDRLWHGAVIDFIHVHYLNVYHYPVFNIADSAIFCGAVIFILSSFFRPEPSREKAQ